MHAPGGILQSSESYGGLGATYDYGPLGVEGKRNVRDSWGQAMIYQHHNIVGAEASREAGPPQLTG